jgi:E3 ubiquitin-protein ligase Topors
MRRELRVWSLVDVEFLTNYILSLLKAIDIRSEPAIRLLAEFLETPNGPQYPNAAEHFAHEVYSFLRSPFKELRKYDAVAQVCSARCCISCVQLM